MVSYYRRFEDEGGTLLWYVVFIFHIFGKRYIHCLVCGGICDRNGDAETCGRGLVVKSLTRRMTQPHRSQQQLCGFSGPCL